MNGRRSGACCLNLNPQFARTNEKEKVMSNDNSRDDVTVDLDLRQVDLAELEGEEFPGDGKYHVRIEGARRVSDRTPYLGIRMVVLAGADPSAVGRVFTERFYLTDGAIKRLKVLAHRLGLLPEGAIGTVHPVNWREAIGRQLVVEVVKEEYEKDGKKQVHHRLGFAGFWAVTDERVVSVPKDQAALREAAGQAAPARTGTADDFADL
jgi:hypothetical protein